ncbi:FG-GAP-like repeat-containing protein [Hymenobacter sp. ASUV-10]|uniref:FG-GAP-like repeat-containing protein n=1 Tax=Hymenobacter aranciens TaxID=3063996 RepID=A0ABT9BDD1_9BACT|nr:FG-GAP-like repeat-containing protein [Hymenobacter sp. ASUV-10]MDO7875678.1 FG-GAP-like repeat-containing protein [Hymenobacter sp. ASUV-10]
MLHFSALTTGSALLARPFRLLLAGLGLALLPLLARAGTPVLTLQATVPTGPTDVTAFADQVELVNAATGAVVAGAVPNAGFETTGSLGAGSYGYAPTGATWTFSPTSGLAANGSIFGNPAAPEGSRVALVQTTSGGSGSLSQQLPDVAAGYYQLRLRLAQRNTTTADQGVAVLINGVEIGRSVPANDGTFHTYTTAVFPLGQVQLRFETARPPGSGVDVTAFVDDVTLLRNGTAVADAVANPSFENTGSLGSGPLAYQPTGASWAFAGNAGIMTTGSGFGSYTNLDGTHAAFLQTTTAGGSATLDLGPLPATGSYAVRLRMAQRSSGTADQKLYLLFDGSPLDNLSPSINGGAFASFTTTDRTVRLPVITGPTPASAAAGTPLTLVGTNLSGAAYVSVDGVAVVPTNVNSGSLRFVLPAGVSAAPSIVVTTRFGLSNVSTALAGRLRVTGTSPAANALTAPLTNSAVALTFTEPVTASSAANIAVFSAQAGGRKAGAVSVSGNTARFAVPTGTPRTNFKPGELVSVSVPATVQSAGGLAVQKKVYQFTTAVGGTGRGNFLPPATNPDPAVGTNPVNVVVGDVDGDGDLDFVTANSNANSVSVRLNDGTGSFTPPTTNPDFAVGGSPVDVVLGDVDGDGDLDLFYSTTGGTVGLRLNDGAGNFTTSAPNSAVSSSPRGMALGDVDGDGDLDLLVANFGTNGTVSVRLNNGSGSFTAPATNPDPAVGTNPVNVVLGDVDGDGDLDLLAANTASNTVSVRLNDGTGNFTAPATNSNPAVGDSPTNMTIGDVDGDGDLDFVTTNLYVGTVSVRLNDGDGNFTAPATNPDPAVGDLPNMVVLDDVDGDGDLDLLTANYGSGNISVRLNNGSGNFMAPATNPDPAVGSVPLGVTLGDVDGDGDLDLLAANRNSNTISVRLNQPPAPAISSISPGTSTAGTPSVVLTGTNLAGASSVSVNGVPVTPTAVTATSLTFTVPAGTGPTQSITVTTSSGTSAAYTGFAVRLRVTGTSPAANALTAPLTNSAVAVTFTEPVTAASAASIGVFSAQAGGRKAGTVTTSGSTARFAATASTPRTNFRPGELVSVTVPATVQSAGGLAVQKKVYQFTTAVGGTGRGNFLPPATNPELAVGGYPQSVAVGDVDGDGDLDLLTANSGDNSVSVRLNNGSGSFSGAAAPAVGTNPVHVVVGDVDGDGDLDFVTANFNGSTASVRLNNGSGSFGGGSDVGVRSNPHSVALGDVDGDGDLDLLTANSGDNSVSVRLNNGSGSFSGGTDVGVDQFPTGVAMGDVDGDGDLDFVTANYNGNTVSIRLNNGSGAFSGGSNPAVGSRPRSVALGDVDGDGDLDMLAANSDNNTVSVRLNNGSGTFGSGSNPAVDNSPQSVAVGDVDGDGDLDLLTANYNGNTVSVRLNNGSGAFSGGSDPAVGSPSVAWPCSVVLGDVDGDGNLDLLTANYGTGTVSVRLNLPPRPTLTSISPAAELPGQAVTLTGTSFTSGSTVRFGGVAASSVTVNSATSLTAVVPVGAAAGSTAVVVSTPGGSSAGSPAFEVLQVYRSASASGCLSTAPLTLDGTGGAGTWRYLRLPGAGGAVVAALEDTQNLGTVTAGVLALGTATSAAVRRDGLAGRAYLDRNFYLTAANASFPGQTVRVRFFGLSSELARLQATDANATLATLKASQYDGANVNCALADNDPTGERRLLTGSATQPNGADWFVGEFAVPDHFSEFYLTAAATPLPVELLTFTATAEGPAAHLAWATASEKNSAAFEVERSADGKQFARLGTVAAAGTSSAPRAYTYLDATRLTGPSYYRLRQLDQDGTARYSPVRVVNGAREGGTLRVFPNPAHRAATVAGLPAGAAVQVLDALGRPVARATADASGTARLALPAGLAPGVYIVRSSAQARRLTVE